MTSRQNHLIERVIASTCHSARKCIVTCFGGKMHTIIGGYPDNGVDYILIKPLTP